MWCVVSVQRKLFFAFCGLLLGLCPLAHANNSPNFRFEHLLNYFSDNEKPHGILPFIVQDHQGMMWLGGEKIYRFDGLEFKPYLENTNPYCSSFILSMVVDKTGVLWVATEKGICIYDAPTDQFVPFVASNGAKVSIYVSALAVSPTNEVYVGSRNQMAIINASRASIIYYPLQVAKVKADATNDFRAIFFESTDRVWVGTMATGLLHFSPQTGQYQQVLNQSALPVADVRSIAMDDSGFLWLGLHQGGVSKYNPATKILKNYLTPNDDYGLGSKYIWPIIKDSQGFMWLAANGDGLMYYDAANDRFEHYRHKASDASSIGSNKPIAIFEDSEKNLWISLYPKGLDLVNRQHEKIKRFKSQGENPSSINDDGILSIFEDSQNTLWVGTEKGLNRYIPGANSFENYSAPGAAWQIPPVPITAIAEDTHKNLWLSTWGSGLYRYNHLTKTVTHFQPQANNPKTVDTAILWGILIDGDKLWFASEGFTGLLMFDEKTQTFERQPLVIPAGNTGIINSYDILQDDRQQLWVASTNGLYVVSADRQSARLLSSLQPSALTITSFRVYSLLQGNNGDIWVGTADQGLFRFNQATQTFTHLHALNLPSSTIMRIQQSADGSLWLFTLNGLVKLNPQNLEHKILNTTQGLVDGNFNRGAGFIDSQQTVYAGGAQGLSIFNLADLDAEPTSFPVHVTGFKLFNQTVPIGPASALKQHIMVTDRIVLDYTQSIFTLYFSGLSYPLSHWNHYAFMLEGYDKQWNYVGDTAIRN
ncbi:MAG: two-component regulator propeller domain-containing protein, partial [Marinagarivorans sp.]|nr:two-component regulator propeller domain-containing protein [Marinagarivorans sp.]